MKDVKLIGLYFAPHLFAISLLRAFIAARCGSASSCARSYEIAPECSQSRMVLISSVCFIISSFIFLFSYALDCKGRPFKVQGFSRFFIIFLRSFRKISSFFKFLIFSFSAFLGTESKIILSFQFHWMKTESKTLWITQSKRIRGG